MDQKQRYSKENYRKMAHVVAPRNSKKRKHKSFKCEIPVFNLHQKAESVEVLDKGLTTSIFTIYFFIVPRHMAGFNHSNILFTFAPPDLLSS